MGVIMMAFTSVASAFTIISTHSLSAAIKNRRVSSPQRNIQQRVHKSRRLELAAQGGGGDTDSPASCSRDDIDDSLGDAVDAEESKVRAEDLPWIDFSQIQQTDEKPKLPVFASSVIFLTSIVATAYMYYVGITGIPPDPPNTL
jgi:hypothetical protein